MRRPNPSTLFQIVVLVATAVAVVASQGPADVWTTTDQVPGPTLTLTAEEPSRTFTAVLTTFPSDTPLGEPVSADVEVVATFYWEPPAGDTAPERPEVELTLAPEGSPAHGSETEGTVLSERETTRLTVVSRGLDGCTDGDTCSERFTLLVRRSGAPSEGEVTVDLAASATVFGGEGQLPPAGFGASLTLE